jgi:hypothetical protein
MTMAKKIIHSGPGRPWTKEEVRMMKSLAREKTMTTVIARKLKRSVGAVQHKASALGVILGGGRGKQRGRDGQT